MLTLYRLFGLAVCGGFLYAASIGWTVIDFSPTTASKPTGPSYYHK